MSFVGRKLRRYAGSKEIHIGSYIDKQVCP